MSATQGAELGSRAQLGGLFFKERVLRLTTPVPGWARLTIGERSLRILITVLVSLFLIMLALALFVQLAQSRKTHLAEQNRQTLLYATAAAQHIKQATRSQIQSGFTPKPFTQEDLDAKLDATAPIVFHPYNRPSVVNALKFEGLSSIVFFKASSRRV